MSSSGHIKHPEGFGTALPNAFGLYPCPALSASVLCLKLDCNPSGYKCAWHFLFVSTVLGTAQRTGQRLTTLEGTLGNTPSAILLTETQTRERTWLFLVTQLVTCLKQGKARSRDSQIDKRSHKNCCFSCLEHMHHYRRWGWFLTKLLGPEPWTHTGTKTVKSNEIEGWPITKRMWPRWGRELTQVIRSSITKTKTKQRSPTWVGKMQNRSMTLVPSLLKYRAIR